MLPRSAKKQQTDSKELADFNDRETEQKTAPANMSEQERRAILARGIFPYSSGSHEEMINIESDEQFNQDQEDEKFAIALRDLRATLRSLADRESVKNVAMTLQKLDSLRLTEIVSSDCRNLIALIKYQKENSPEDTGFCTKILTDTNNLIKQHGVSATHANNYIKLAKVTENKSSAWHSVARVMGVIAGVALIALGFAALIGTMGGAGALSALSIYFGVKLAAAFLAPAIGSLVGLTVVGAASNHKSNWEQASEYMNCAGHYLKQKANTPLFYKPVTVADPAVSSEVKSAPAKPLMRAG